MPEVHTLVIECGRRVGDDLPARATGARIVCYAPGVDLEDAISAATAVVVEAGLTPLKVTGQGTLSERQARGEITGSERTLMNRALRVGRVVIVDLTPIYDQT